MRCLTIITILKFIIFIRNISLLEISFNIKIFNGFLKENLDTVLDYILSNDKEEMIQAIVVLNMYFPHRPMNHEQMQNYVRVSTNEQSVQYANESSNANVNESSNENANEPFPVINQTQMMNHRLTLRINNRRKIVN